MKGICYDISRGDYILRDVNPLSATWLYICPKAKPPVIEIEKEELMRDGEGEARAGIESLSLWTFWHLKG